MQKSSSKWFYPAVLYVFLILLTGPVSAQPNNDEFDSKYSFEFAGHVGNLLPNQIEGVTEILPLWGTRVGFKTQPGVFFELGGIAGKAEGSEWLNASASVRMDMPIEGLLGIVYLGADVTRFKGVNKEEKTFGGGHLGGGLMAMISPTLWFRSDMKFNVNPGTSLYISFGFTMRFGSDGGQN